MAIDNDNDVVRLNYTKLPQGFGRFSIEEHHLLNPGTCPYCSSTTEWRRVEHDIVGGKYLAYVVHVCRSCGWWNSFKYWEDRSGEKIYRVDRNKPHLEEFDIASKKAEIELVLQAIRRNFADLRYVHWKVFEQTVRIMLSERGFSIVDVSRSRSTGVDLLGVDLDGKRVAIEIKHYNYRPVGIAVVDRLRGAIQRKSPERQGAERGLIVTSAGFSKDALDAMETLSLSRAEEREDVIPISGLDFNDIVTWLRLRDNRSPDEVLQLLAWFHLQDALSEQ